MPVCVSPALYIVIYYIINKAIRDIINDPVVIDGPIESREKFEAVQPLLQYLAELRIED